MYETILTFDKPWRVSSYVGKNAQKHNLNLQLFISFQELSKSRIENGRWVGSCVLFGLIPRYTLED